MNYSRAMVIYCKEYREPLTRWTSLIFRELVSLSGSFQPYERAHFQYFWTNYNINTAEKNQRERREKLVISICSGARSNF